jgi:hypothetical protein
VGISDKGNGFIFLIQKSNELVEIDSKDAKFNETFSDCRERQGKLIKANNIYPDLMNELEGEERQSEGNERLINGKNGFDSEIELGVGWQDPAVIGETGLCVWRSGPKPELDFKQNGDFLTGRMAILWTGSQHDTPSFADLPRDYDRIAQSGRIAREGVLTKDIHQIAAGVNLYHQTQLDEGMQTLPEIAGSIAHKYCGGGYGGYGLYLFEDAALRDAAVSSIEPLRSVEPFCRV